MRTRLILKNLTKKRDEDCMDLKSVVIGNKDETLDMTIAYIVAFTHEYQLPIETIIKNIRHNYKHYVTQMEGEDK